MYSTLASNSREKERGKFKIGIMEQVKRFLIIGSTENTFHMTNRELTTLNTDVIKKAIVDGKGIEIIKETIDVSYNGKAFKNDPAIWVCALIMAYGTKENKEYLIENITKICRTGTHILTLAKYIKDTRGWGTTVKRLFEKWFEQDNEKLIYQVLKYKQRNGFAMRDLLRLCHIKPKDVLKDALFSYIVNENIDKIHETKDGFQMIVYVETIKAIWLNNKITKEQKISHIKPMLMDSNITREMIPTDLLALPDIQEIIMRHSPATALIRNLASWTASGMLKGQNVSYACEQLNNDEWLKKNRIHPLTILNALTVYGNGKGEKGSLVWTPNKDILNALEFAFYKSFDAIEPTGKRIMIGLDVSGSMCWESSRPEGMVLTASEISAVFAMATMRSEIDTSVYGFGGHVLELGINTSMKLKDVLKKISSLNFGGTDPGLLIHKALTDNKIVDAFIIYTDNEVNRFSKGEVANLFEQYKEKVNKDAKIICVATVANDFDVIDTTDGSSYGIAGFSTDTPKLIAEIIKGNIK